MRIYDKPFLNTSEMLRKLANEKNLIINNHTFAVEVLRKLSYYDLINGSKEVFIKEDFDGKEIYKDNTTLEDLYNFYMINDAFQNIIVRRLFMIENLFKNELAYVVSEKFGVDVDTYLDKLNYRKYIHPKNKKIKTSNLLEKILYESRSTSNNPTMHYRKKHNHIPPWILFRNISFNDSIQLFSALNSDEQEEVCNRLVPINFQNKKGTIKNMLNLSRLYRNEIVHNYKFVTYEKRIKTSVSLNHIVIPSKMLISNSSGKDVYTLILCILILLNSDKLRVSFLFDIIAFLEFKNQHDPTTQMIYDKYFELIGLPSNFNSKISWYLNHISKNDTM